MIVKQVSVFVENTVGRLAELTKILKKNNIDLKAATIAETIDFGILRCIVANPEKTAEILIKNGFTASTTEVIGVSINNVLGGLNEVLEILAKEGIAVNYIYSTVEAINGSALIIMKISDPKKAVEILTKNEIKLMKLSEMC